MNEQSIANLFNAVSDIDLSCILQSDNVDFSIEVLDKTLLDNFNQHCPIIRKKITKKDREKPWINDSLKRLILNRQNHFRWYKNGIISHECYKRIRNLVTNRLNE